MRDGGSVAWALAIAVTLGTACTGPAPQFDGERYRVPDRPSTIAAPGGEGASWRPVSVSGTALAFRGQSGSAAANASMSLLERCEEPPLQPRLAARQLLIGLEERAFTEDRAVEVAGAPGWLQGLAATDGSERVALRTVTRVDPGCSLDWILVAPVDARLDDAFDAWWGSWRPDGTSTP